MRIGLTAGLLWLSSAAPAFAGNPLHTASGAPVHWAAPEIRVAADAASPSKSLAAEAVAEAIAGAAAAWNAQPELKVRLTAASAASDVDVRVRFCTGTWTAAAGLLANSEYEADPATGVVTSAVVVVDECDYRFVGPNEVEEGAFDLQAVLTHELGHVLGLGHSADPKAVMFPSTGTVRQRRPGPDDRGALAALYGSAPDRPVPRVLAPSLVPALTPPALRPGEVIRAAPLEAGAFVLYTGELVVLPAMDSAAEPPGPVAPAVRSGDRARRRPASKRPPARAR